MMVSKFGITFSRDLRTSGEPMLKFQGWYHPYYSHAAKNEAHLPIPSMGLVYLPIHEWFDFYGIHVAKKYNRSMDP